MMLQGNIPATANAMYLRKLASSHIAGAFISAQDAARLLIGSNRGGLLSLSEYAQFFRQLRTSTNLPLIADGQCGYGNALNTYVTAKELARSGADYMILNDRKYPNTSLKPTNMEDPAGLLGKAKAALDGLKGSNTELLIELQGINEYKLSGLEERLAILKKCNAKHIILDYLTKDQLAKLRADNMLGSFGYDSNDDLSLSDLKSFKPAFILDTNNSLKQQNTDIAQFADQAAKSNDNQMSATSNADYDKFDKMREQFKKQVFTKGNLINMVVAPDSLAAKIAQSLGFKAIFAAGYATSASNLALPDRGIADFGIMLNKCREIINAVHIPVFADADTGYGDDQNVARTVRGYENAGAAGIFLEDQIWPKRCGHMAGKSVEPTQVLVNKIKTAVKARRHRNFLIMSRTDARAVYGFKAAVERSKKYLKAGADLVFMEAPKDIHELKAEKKYFPNTPLMANMIEGGQTPLMSDEQLRKMGFSICVRPTALTYGQTYAEHHILSILKKTGNTTAARDHMLSFDQFNKFIGLDQVNARDDMYSENNMKALLKKWNFNNK